MQKTIFHTPILSHAMHYISRMVLFFLGWTHVNNPKHVPKYVMIAAPHTSNWDFFYTMLVAFALKLKVYAMGKKALTEGPFGPIMLWLGIIPIDRSRSGNVVSQTIETFNAHDDLIIIIPPSGTRNKVQFWKTGFYHIARGAGVPICLGFIDYKRKKGGLGPFVMPTDDYDRDMTKIKSFYSGITGKYPDKQIDKETPEA
jgi:1-acyl-sn-glycerol-3-phosphate acyltransferase